MDCKNHKETSSTHVTNGNKEPLCDNCAVAARENGILVSRHRGFLWGYPILVEGDDGTLDAPVLEEK